MTRSGLMAVAVWLLLSGAAVAATPSGDASDAQGVVERLHIALLAVMQEAAQLGYAGRYEQLEPVVRASFDLPFVAEISAGRHWKEFDDAQRTKLVEAVSELSVATYAARFDGFSGERFEIAQAQPTGRGQTLVRARLVKANGETVQLDYLLRPDEGGWRIINVIADGVSDLSLKRAEYTSVVKKDGVGALLAKLHEKLRDYAAGEAD